MSKSLQNSKTPSRSDCETDYSLINRIRDPQDNESWSEFSSFYRPYINRVCCRFKLSQSEIDEIQQIIIIKLWKIFHEFTFDKSRGKFRQWLSAIIRNEVLYYFRKNKISGRLVEQNDSYILTQTMGVKENEEIDEIVKKEWVDYVSSIAWERIKVRFNERIQKVYVLSNEGKSVQEIAEECNIKENTVYVFRQRLKQFLRDEVRKENLRFL